MSKPKVEKKARGWGGARAGAGRKPKGARSMVSRVKRPPISADQPVQIRMALLPHVASLHSKRTFKILLDVLAAGSDRFGFRLCDFAADPRELRFLVEADDEQSLSRGMQGLSIRVAKALNAVMEKRGPVFADRYEARALDTPAAVKDAVAAVAKAEFSSAHHDVQLAKPTTQLLSRLHRAR